MLTVGSRSLALLVLAFAGCAVPTVPGVPPVTVARPVPRPPAPLRFDYPASRRTSDADALHGVSVGDPYRWLEADDAEVTQWMEQQDARARREIDKLDGRKALVDQMSKLVAAPLTALPTRRGKLAFTQDDKAIKVREGESNERVAFDKTTLPAGTRVSRLSPSPDGSLLALELSKNGADMRTVRVVDVKTGRPADELAGFEGSSTIWGRAGFFYAYTPPDAAHAARWAQRDIRFHRLGTPQSADRIVVVASNDKDASDGMNPVAITSDGTRLLAQTFENWSKTTFAVVDLAQPSWPVHESKANGGKVVNAAVVEDSIFVLVRRDDGTTEVGRVTRRLGDPPEILARTGSQLLSMDAYGTNLVLTYAATPGAGATSFVRREIYDKNFHKLADTVTPRGMTDRYYADPHTSRLLVTRDGLGSPQLRFVLDPKAAEGERERVFAPSAVDFDRSSFTLDTLDAKSKDGTIVPITILRRKDTPIDGSGAIMAYGYGGFRGSAEQIFYPPWMVWASRPGGVFASCHLRGGLEFGEAWHDGGARRNRQNTIDDFHACLEELHRRGYGTAAHTMTQGWSHGGMLVAAAAMQRPDLQRVVASLAPLADMVRFPLFGRGGVSEYGDPDDAEDFRALYAFSPYHHVREGARYPSFFITAPSNDERVHPMHPRKLAAALQHASTGGEVLLKVLWDAGHLGGGKDDTKAVIVEAMTFALREFARPL